MITITDTRSSPLAATARHASFIPHASSFYSNARAAAALAERERLISEMHIEI